MEQQILLDNGLNNLKRNSMGSPDLGPEWVWEAGCVCAFIGMMAFEYFLIKGFIWLFNHVTIE
jgi:hypothetical protein